MTGRRLAVLGGCGGIGRGVVARAHAEGWQVTVLDLAASIAAHPVPAGVMAIPIDGSDEASVSAAFAAIPAQVLEGFVNLAGFNGPMLKLGDTPAPTFDDVITGNLRTAFLTARAALPLLAKGRDAAMVQVVSGLAAFTRPNYGPYAAAKAAMVSMTKTLALENAPGVRVNAIGPAAVDTAFLRGGTGRSDEKRTPGLDMTAYAAAIPLKRIATVEDIVGPILFLLSADSRYMTGQVLWVNGGAYMP